MTILGNRLNLLEFENITIEGAYLLLDRWQKGRERKGRKWKGRHEYSDPIHFHDRITDSNEGGMKLYWIIGHDQ